MPTDPLDTAATLRQQITRLRAALQRLASCAEQVAWTNRGMADVSKDGYWSFVPTDEVKRAAAVLTDTEPQP